MRRLSQLWYRLTHRWHPVHGDDMNEFYSWSHFDPTNKEDVK